MVHCVSSRWARAVISLFGSVTVAWPVAAQMQSTTQPTQSMTSSSPKVQVVHVKLIHSNAPTPRFQLRDGVVDLTKGFNLGGSEGIGAAWKLPPIGETFDARYGRW